MAKKVVEDNGENAIKEFNNYFKLNQEREHEEIQQLYNHIKKSYKIKFKDDEMKIRIEKINLERNIGKYQGALRKHGLSFFIAILGIMLQLILPELLKIFNVDSNINSAAIKVAFMILFMLWFMYSVGKGFDNQRPKDLMNYIALKVLEDIEIEIKEDKLKNNLSFQESAATIDDDMEKDSIVKKDNKGIRGLINIISITKVERRK